MTDRKFEMPNRVVFTVFVHAALDIREANTRNGLPHEDDDDSLGHGFGCGDL